MLWVLTDCWLIAWRFEPEWWRLTTLDKFEPSELRLWLLELLSEPKIIFLTDYYLVTTLRLGGWPASQPFAANSSPSPTFSAGFGTLKCEMDESVILILTLNSLYRGEISIWDSRKIILQSHRLSIEPTTFIVRKSSGVSSGYKGC